MWAGCRPVAGRRGQEYSQSTSGTAAYYDAKHPKGHDSMGGTGDHGNSLKSLLCKDKSVYGTHKQIDKRIHSTAKPAQCSAAEMKGLSSLDATAPCKRIAWQRKKHHSFTSK
jgi:hypothetical protein